MKAPKRLLHFRTIAVVAIRATALAMLKVFRKTFGLLALALATLGLGVAAVNPLPWIAHLLPVKLATAWGVIHISESSLQASITTLYTDQIVFGSVIGVALLLIVVAWVAWFPHPIRALVHLYRGLRASPMAIVHAPV